VLYLSSELVSSFFILFELRQKINLHARSLNVLSHIDDFLETRHSKRHVLRRHTSEMESVQCHLCRRLAYRLSAYRSNHLPRVCYGLIKARLDFTNHPVKRLLVHAFKLNHVFGAQ
jgi:hypothetical protein